MVHGRQNKVKIEHMVCAATLAHPRMFPVAEVDWVLKSEIWSTDPGREQLFIYGTVPDGTGIRSYTSKKVYGKSLEHRRSKVLMLSAVQLQPLSHHLSPRLLGGEAIKADLPAPQAKSSSAHVEPRVLCTTHPKVFLRINSWCPFLRYGTHQYWQGLSPKAWS